MDNKFFGFSNGNGNTTHCCLACTRDCRTCIFRGMFDRSKKAAEDRWSAVDEIQKDVGMRGDLNEERTNCPSLDGIISDESELSMSTAEKVFYAEDEKEETTVLMCKPYLVTIDEISHEFHKGAENTTIKLSTDETNKVIKKPWSPHGSNLDNELDSIVFGYALHHLAYASLEYCVTADNALKLVQDYEPITAKIIYPVGMMNFMAKDLVINCVEMMAAVRRLGSSRNKKWTMAVFEVMGKSFLNDNEYFIGLPMCEVPDRDI